MIVAMNLEPHQLIAHLHEVVDASAKVCADSRQIASGDIFFAYPVGHGSARRDGREFIESALKNGAGAVVFDPAGMTAFSEHPQCFAINHLAAHAGKICSEWYDDPSQHLKVIGVTGTNGKTTVATLSYQLFKNAGYKAGLLSTVKICSNNSFLLVLYN